jgi:glutaminyl-peptide cyclotransferase
LYSESRNQYLEIDEATATIKPVMVEPIADELFGEGISVLNDTELIQLTWMENVVNILDRESLKVKRTLPACEGVKQGWGITLNPITNELYVSDGSSKITKVNASSLEKIGELTVQINPGQAIDRINELEFVNGFIWANLFQHSFIVKIDPATGQVVRVINLANLANAEMKLVEDLNEHRGYDRGNNVLNGIAYDTENDEFYLTGKRWHMMFKLRIHD